NAAAVRRRTQAQDQADEPGGAGRANAPGGGGRAQAANRDGGGDRVEISNAARNAQQGAVPPRETQGRRQPVEQGGNEGAAEVRARQGGRPEPNAGPAEARGNAGGGPRARRAEEAQEEEDTARARRSQNPGRNVGTRIDVAG
ncbi:hypothetical protein HYY27_01165, partial [bacterium]|nr:hypothetical protein [bacterium]